MRRSRKLTLVALAIVAACGSDDSVSDAPDGAADASLDASRADSAGNPTDASSVLDAGTDSATDAGTDATLDAPTDSPADADDAADAADATDADDAASSDAAPDVATDAGPIDCADAGAPVLTGASGFSSVSVFSEDAKLMMPSSLAGNGDRRFWIQDPVGNGLSGDKMIDLASDGVATDRPLPGTAATCGVSQVAIDAAGNGYVFDTALDVIYRTTPAGTVTSFSNVGNIGGGGNCNDSGVIGMLIRPDGTFFLGSPKNDKIYTLSADGVTRADFADVTAPGRLADDGANGVLVASGSTILDVSSAGVVTTRLDATGVLGNVGALRRDANGDLYFSSGSRLYRSKDATTTFDEVAACFVGGVSDILFDHPVNDAGAGTSLYVLTSGANNAAHDPGDQLLEMKR
jgi:hypothetical protein